MSSPLRTISCDIPLTVMSVANGLIIAGDSGGNVIVMDPSEKMAATAGGCLQKFSDHKGVVMDIYAVSSVMSCHFKLFMMGPCEDIGSISATRIASYLI